MAAAPQESQDSKVRLRSYQDESYLHGFLGIVGDLQKAGVLQDVVLEVEGRRFPCHRLVLSAASPYFRAMFTSDLTESRHKTVVLQGLDVAMFEEILSYIYSGTLHVSLDKVQPLYQAADLLQLDYVRDTCSSYMAMNVERCTCVDLYKFAEVFSVDIVLKRCLQFICKHFVTVASSDKFCSLSVNQLTKIISHDELDVKEETTVWEAVVRWVQHSREDRLHHLPSILPHIRFNLLTSDDMAAILEHPLIRENPESSKVIRKMAWKLKLDLKPRLGMTTEMLLLRDIGTGDLLYMNPQKRKYIWHPDIFPDSAGTAFTRDHNIYVLEHDRDHTGQLSMFKYNHAGNEFEDAGMSTVSEFQREYSDTSTDSRQSLVEVGQTLYYVAADLEEGSGLVRMRKYSRQKDQWQECSQLELEGTWDCSAVLPCGPHLYFIVTSAMYRYDPSQDCWSERTPPNLESRFSFLTAVAMGTEIFCTDSDFNQTKVYDTESDHWKKLQGWPNRGNLGTNNWPYFFLLEDQLHVLLDTYDSTKEGPRKYLVYVYDRSADAWRDLKAILPDTEYYTLGHLSSVARLYLPFLKGAQNLITSYAIWQDKYGIVVGPT